MKKFKYWFWNNGLRILMWTGITLIAIFALINVFWVIYAFAKYGGKPISEIPYWALWYMFKH